MGNRKRVMSFISNLSTGTRDGRTVQAAALQSHSMPKPQRDEPTAIVSSQDLSSHVAGSSQLKTPAENGQSNPKVSSVAQPYETSLTDPVQSIIPELQPIFSLLNDHANKLYQEGYFLKLDDQNTQGKPNPDRIWVECFAQLVGTVLSLWDAAELDEAGQEGEVLPKFINLTDASIKMIESLPTRSDTEAPLQNIISISTAGKNRYLLHFNSHHSLIKWTAGIRLAMYEHAILQEAYTGALIAGKGKSLNNIKAIMVRSRSATADWVRVRFGAGTPWRRCWCVISPPADKELMRLQKQWKKSPYDRSKPPFLKGVVRFYQNKKTKKVNPIASIPDAYSAFAIYPQSKPLIDASTLVKVEGSIIIHSNPPSTTEGFVFVMPEVHPGVTGFEMMLRWLFPVFDTFGLYGRPGRLVAATEDIRSLMFAMPTHRRSGYLETLDVAGLILEKGSSNWKESYWRKRMKELTEKRMMAIESDNKPNNMSGNQKGNRNSTAEGRTRGVKFNDDEDDASIKSSRFNTWAPNLSFDGAQEGSRTRTDSVPHAGERGSFQHGKRHNRSASETQTLDRFQIQNSTSYLESADDKLSSLIHTSSHTALQRNDQENASGRLSSEDERLEDATSFRELQELNSTSSPEPVAVPPAFLHAPGSLPSSKPHQLPELRRANSRMSTTTLKQLTEIGRVSENPEARVLEEGRDILDSIKYELPANNLDSKKDVSTSNQSIELAGQLQCTYSSESSTIPYPPPKRKLPLVPSNLVKRPGSSPSTNSNSSYTPKIQDGAGFNQKPLPHAPNNSNVKTLSMEKVGSESVPPGGHFINQDLFDKISYESSFSSIEAPKNKSDYEDNCIVNSQDYLPKNKPAKTLRDLDKPRVGVKRTVGEEHIKNYEDLSDSLALDIDFGPTINYASSKNSSFLSGNIGIKNFKVDQNERSSHQENLSHAPNTRRYSQELKTEALGKSGRESRIMAWKPVLVMGGNTVSQQKVISPEDYVTRRASIHPTYLHQRVPSFDALRTTKTSQLIGNRLKERPGSAIDSRHVSTDLSMLKNTHFRNYSGDLLRLSSRDTSLSSGISGHGRNISSDMVSRMAHSSSNLTDLLSHPRLPVASPALSTVSSSNSNSNINMTAHLTAREQEHLAKITGQPFINMTTNRKTVPAAGLVAALEARERDKNALKQGLCSRAVENIIQRQQGLYQKSTYPPYESQRKNSITNTDLITAHSPTQSLFHSSLPTSNHHLQSNHWTTAQFPLIVTPKHERSYSAFTTSEHCTRARQQIREKTRFAQL